MKLFSAMSSSERNDLAKAKAEQSKRFLGGGMTALAAERPRGALASTRPTQNVVGVGIDEKYVDDVPTGIPAVKFLVKSKFLPSAVPKKDLLPKSVAGFETDVEEVGLIVPQGKTRARVRAAAGAAAMPNPQTKIRPAQPGSSVGFREPNNAFIMAGTFGLLVKDTAGVHYVLSNNHVLAFESGVQADGATIRVGLPVGSPIFQPGLLDGGNPNTDQIAKLTRWVDLRADRTDNAVDGAIAELDPQNGAIADILFIGVPQATAAAAKDMVVHKFGRTTSYRAGRVSSVAFDVTIHYEVGDVVFEDQIAIRGLNGQRFSDAGDSGSAILERETNNVVGLLFAGATNGSLTFANQIAGVFAKLKVKLA
jgi:hypothetical protein